MITIINKSPHDQKVYHLEVNCSVEQFEAWIFGRRLIQNAMPHLSDDEREFILSGLYPGQFEEYVGDMDEFLEKGADEDEEK